MSIRLLSSILMSVLVVLPSRAQEVMPGPGDLAVFPTSLSLDDRTRNGELELKNVGKHQATYRISFQHLQMLSDGSLREVEHLPNSAAPLLRFSPRQITLEAGERQVVRLQVRRPANLTEGEYRVHVLFRAVPPSEAVKPVSKSTEGIRVNLVAIPGASIPIEVIHGKREPSFGLEQPELLKAPLPRIRVDLVQKGRVGVRGKLVLYAGPLNRPLVEGAEYKEIGNMDVVHYGDLSRQTLVLDVPVASLALRPAPLKGPNLLVLMDNNDRILADIPFEPPPFGGTSVP